MKLSEVQQIAKKMGVKTSGVTKTGLIQEVQRKEGNIDCYGTGRVEFCEEFVCLWREDCIDLNKPKGKPKKSSTPKS